MGTTKMQHKDTKYKRKRLSAPLMGVAVMASGLVAPLFAGIAPAYAASTTFYLSPSSANVTVNSTFTVGVRINTSEQINAVEANLNYNASQLQFVSISDTGSAFEIKAAQGGGNGSVAINRGQIGGVTGDKLIVDVTFKALSSNATSAVSFGSSQALRDSDNSNALSGTSGGSYALKATGAATPPVSPVTPGTTKPPTPAPAPSQTPTPAPSTPPGVSPTPTPGEVSPAPKEINGSSTSEKITVWGLSGLAVLVIGVAGFVLFLKRRATVTPLPGAYIGDAHSAVFGPSPSVPSAIVTPTVTTPDAPPAAAAPNQAPAMSSAAPALSSPVTPAAPAATASPAAPAIPTAPGAVQSGPMVTPPSPGSGQPTVSPPGSYTPPDRL